MGKNKRIRKVVIDMMYSKMEKRVYEGSTIVGMSIGKIKKRFDVSILKVTRGNKAVNPSDNLILDVGDYIFLVGKPDDIKHLN